MKTLIPKLIKETTQDTKILFHCYAGVSRSASLAIAYLMKTNIMTFDKAYELVKMKRNMINPNNGFMEALHKFEDYEVS